MMIKICGITSVNNAVQCFEAGADMIGLVQYPPSPRHLELTKLAEIVRAVSPFRESGKEIVLLVVDQNAQETLRILDACDRQFDFVQFYGDETEAKRLEEHIRVLRPIRNEALYNQLLSQNDSRHQESDMPRYVLELTQGKLPGGNGASWDWSKAKPFCEKFPTLLAGGITPENVVDAMRFARPFGVDLSSGVETSPGAKNIDLVRRLVDTVRSVETENDRIAKTFQRCRQSHRIALIGYLTAGEPNFARSLEIIDTACDAGLDILELGIPCADPHLDGPVIRKAHKRALDAGMTVEKSLTLVQEIRKRHDLPVILMTYCKPVSTLGINHFIQKANESQVDGVLIVDLPKESVDEMQECVDRSKPFYWIRLITPEMNSLQQEETIRKADGFIYIASRKGVTGAGTIDWHSLSREIADLRPKTKTPLCVGFGISTSKDVRKVAKLADGVIAGTILQKLIQEYSQTTCDAISALLRSFHIATMRKTIVPD